MHHTVYHKVVIRTPKTQRERPGKRKKALSSLSVRLGDPHSDVHSWRG